MTTIQQRHKEMMESFESVVELEKLYFNIGADLGMLNDKLSALYYDARQTRLEMKKNKEYKSIAAFNSEYKDTEKYVSMKMISYQIDGLNKMMAGIRVRVESLRMELKGNY